MQACEEKWRILFAVYERPVPHKKSDDKLFFSKLKNDYILLKTYQVKTQGAASFFSIFAISIHTMQSEGLRSKL